MATLTHDKIRSLLSEVAPGVNWAEVEKDGSLSEAGLDSLDKVTFIMKVEDLTGASIADGIYDELDTIDSISTYIAGLS